jgi:NAD(P)-dependent dehydrogenase (short-subunit alcohol dehydrogenase family)
MESLGTHRRMRGLAALVTGASRGIGRAIALAYAREGAEVVCAATNEALLRDTVAECQKLGPEGRHSSLVLDVVDRAACVAAVRQTEHRLGRIDVLLNGAGVYRGRAFLDYTADDFRWMFDINLMGPMHLMQAALPGMIARSRGSVVNIASTAGKWSSMNQSAYNVSKHALVGLTRCVAQEVAQRGVRVNAICPGVVQTDMISGDWATAAAGKTLDEHLAPVLQRTAMRRILAPDEIATMAVFLACDESSGMTGQSVSVDAGMLYT